MSSTENEIYLSPSEYHSKIMDTIKPLMKFDGKNTIEWQKQLKSKIKELLGDFPEERIPLNPKTIWKRPHKFGIIEKILFSSEPYADTTAYLCLPKDVKPPYKFMICVQGHSTGMHNSIAVDINDNSKPIQVAGDRDFGLNCMKNGFAALCIEQRSFGERKELKRKSIADKGYCHDAAMNALMLGKTLIGERVFDVDRGIDYLLSRDDTDEKYIGVMGNSGGGTVSLFSAAVLPRVKYAMPSSYFCTFQDSVMAIYHCACNYIPGIMKYADMSDVMGLFAPKPVVIVHGKDDKIFPIEATKRSFSELKKIYSAFEAEDNCHLVIGNEGHRFYAEDAWPVMIKEIEKL
jgi:dienelactone hydrolase